MILKKRLKFSLEPGNSCRQVPCKLSDLSAIFSAEAKFLTGVLRCFNLLLIYFRFLDPTGHSSHGECAGLAPVTNMRSVL